MAALRPPPRAGAAGPEPAPSAFEMLRALIEDIPRLIGERVHLLTLELQRAKQALIVIVVLAAVAVLLLLTSWVVIWAAIVAALIQIGLAWGWAVLIVLLINIGGAAVALGYALTLTRFLSLPATVRHLTRGNRPTIMPTDTPFTNPGPAAASGNVPPGPAPERKAP